MKTHWMFCSLLMTTSLIYAANPVVFTAAGDFGNDATASASLSAIAASGSSFFLTVGDLSYGNVSESAWCTYVKSYVGATFPFELLSGNHDGGQEVPGDGLIENFVQCLPDRIGGVTGTYGKEYYFDYPVGSPLIRAIMISPNIVFTNGGNYDYSVGTSHYNFVSNAIDSARNAGIKWIVVGMHKNCMTIGEKDTCETDADIINLLISKKVDLIIQGHDHTYQRSKQLAFKTGCTSITVDGYNAACIADDGADNAYTKGAGPIIVVSAAPGSDLYPITTTDPEKGYFVKWMGGNVSATSGIVKFTATDTQMTAQFVRGSGGSFTDTFTITAPATTGSACDLDGSGSTNVTDVQQCVNQAIGSTTCTTGDIDKNGKCNVIDVQRVVNAALGGQCVTQ